MKTKCGYDECQYIQLAKKTKSISELNLTWKNHIWPPGYFIFVYTILKLSGSVLVLKFIQILLSLVTAFFIYLIARDLFNEKVGLAAVVFTSFYPELIAFTHYSFSETFYIFFLILSFLLIIRYTKTNDYRILVLSALCLGLTSLIRSLVLYFIPIAGIWIAFRDENHIKQALAFILIAFLVVAPWTIHNYLVYDRLVLVDQVLGKNINYGHGDVTKRPRNGDYPRPKPIDASMIDKPLLKIPECKPKKFDNIVDYNTCLVDRSMSLMFAHPKLSLRRFEQKFYDFWYPTSFLLRRLSYNNLKRGYGNINPEISWLVSKVHVYSYITLLLLGLVGLVYSKNTNYKTLFIVFILYYNLVHVLVAVMSRYRLPLMPLLFIYAAYTIQNPTKIKKKILSKIISNQNIIMMVLILIYLKVITLTPTLV